MSLICWWTAISCTPGLSPVLYHPRKSMSENTYTKLSHFIFRSKNIFSGLDLFSFCFKICAIKYDYEILLFKELHFAIDKTSMSSVLVTVPIFVLAEVWHHTVWHCIRCPVALSGQAYFFSCGLGGGLFQAVDILHCLILAFLTLSLSMCWHQPCLFELLLLGVVVVPVDDDHAVDHIVVKFKTVAKLDVPARLYNLHSFTILHLLS